MHLSTGSKTGVRPPGITATSLFCLAERSLTASVNYEKNPIPKVLASVVCESKILILIQSFVPTNRPSDRVR